MVCRVGYGVSDVVMVCLIIALLSQGLTLFL